MQTDDSETKAVSLGEKRPETYHQLLHREARYYIHGAVLKLTEALLRVFLSLMTDAIERHKKLLEQFPQNELARFSLGKAYFDAGNIKEAKEQFELALARKPDWMVVQILIGKCELALNNKAGAKAAFEKGKQLAIEQHHEGPLAEMEQALAELENA